jgi:hypothetical protein
MEDSLIKAGKRPEGMPFALYRVLRNVENLKVKKHLRGRYVWVSAILEPIIKNSILVGWKKVSVQGTYTRTDKLTESRC